MPALIGLMAAGLAAYVAYGLMPVSHAYWKKRVGVVMSDEEETPVPFGRAVLLAVGNLFARFAPARWLLDTRTQLYWAQQRGQWLGWSEVDFWGLRIVGLLAGLALGNFLASQMALIVGGAFGLLYPGMRLSGAAEQATRRFRRELPEAAQLLALLVGTGASLDEALRRLAEGEGMVCAWVRQTLAIGQGRPLFTPVASLGDRSVQPGVFRERAIESGLDELISLAVQLDLISEKGVGAEELLNDLADAVAMDYEGEVQKRAEALGGKLVFPVMLFYFIPYLVALLAPMLGGVVGFIAQ